MSFDADVPDPLGVAVPYLDREPGWVVLGGLGSGREARSVLAHWPHARLLGIDPDPRAVAWQRSNGWPKGMPLLQAALSDKAGQEPICLAEMNCASLHPAQLATAGPCDIDWTETVTLDALDEWYGFTDAILWLDLEDYEYKALCGAEKLLASGRVLLVNVEVRYGREEVGKLRDLLARAGYAHARTWFRQWWGHNEIWRRVC